MILGGDGKRLSKRHGATAVGEYRRQGILPAALRNFLVLLGWAPGDDREIMPVSEMIEGFSLEGINKKSAVFDQQKLLWMNGQYLMATPTPELAALVREQLSFAADAEALAPLDESRLNHAIELLKPRARTVVELAQQVRPYVASAVVYDASAVKKHWQDAGNVSARLLGLREGFAVLPEWDREALEATLRRLAEQAGEPASTFIHPLRVALTGLAASPGIFDVLAVLGRAVSLDRIDAALEKLSAGAF
jgi:glutamyl-tRNA synthetase